MSTILDKMSPFVLLIIALYLQLFIKFFKKREGHLF